MTSVASHATWHIVGAGNIGIQVIDYFQRAGLCVRHISDQTGPHQEILQYADGQSRPVVIDRIARHHINQPIDRLIVACKTPFTDAALAGLPLAESVVVLRLQNGLGSLDGLLPERARLIEAVTTNAVMTDASGARQVVAENNSWIGPGLDDDTCHALASVWPGLQPVDDIRRYQWRKLVANAAINPLTAVFDVPNGKLMERPALRQQLHALVDEADALLAHIDSAWPGDSRADVEAIARATAGNTSSMRADMQKGQITEIQAINGWLIREADKRHQPMPTHLALLQAVEQHSPSIGR